MDNTKNKFIVTTFEDTAKKLCLAGQRTHKDGIRSVVAGSGGEEGSPSFLSDADHLLYGNSCV